MNRIKYAIPFIINFVSVDLYGILLSAFYIHGQPWFRLAQQAQSDTNVDSYLETLSHHRDVTKVPGEAAQ